MVKDKKIEGGKKEEKVEKVLNEIKEYLKEIGLDEKEIEKLKSKMEKIKKIIEENKKDPLKVALFFFLLGYIAGKLRK